VSTGKADNVGKKKIEKLPKGKISKDKKKLRGLSPRANYTDRAAAAGRRS